MNRVPIPHLRASRYAGIVHRDRRGKIPGSVIAQEAGQAGEQQRSDRPSGEDMNP